MLLCVLLWGKWKVWIQDWSRRANASSTSHLCSTENTSAFSSRIPSYKDSVQLEVSVEIFIVFRCVGSDCIYKSNVYVYICMCVCVCVCVFVWRWSGRLYSSCVRLKVTWSGHYRQSLTPTSSLLAPLWWFMNGCFYFTTSVWWFVWVELQITVCRTNDHKALV
jgi:hypothetical protein